MITGLQISLAVSSDRLEADVAALVEKSREVIKSCCLPGGGIAAASSISASYSHGAKNYFYVWPRDASYVCVAADIAGMRNVADGFFKWCTQYAGAFEETGLFWERYYANGLRAAYRLQPDQTGSVLWAAHHHITDR